MSDIALLVRLAYKTAEGARTACGEYDELTREVTGLHNVLNRLDREARKPSSFLNRPGEAYKQELEPLSSRCKHVLTQLDTILVKYNALSEQERSVRKLWKQVRFGTGAVADLADLRSKIASCTDSLSLFINLVSLGTIGEVERKMNQAGGDLTDIKIAVNGITARLSATAGREGSVLTAYTNDDKDAWRELRRGLVKDGFRGSLVRKHMKTIMAYVKELGSRGALDGFDDLGCEEGSDMPSRHDDVYRSDKKCQVTLTIRNPETTGSSSNQAQTIHPRDGSMSISSKASSNSSGMDDGMTGRSLPSYLQPFVENACETASEDGHMESPGTASSKPSYLHTSNGADDMTKQGLSDAEPNIRDILSLDNEKELSQQEVDQYKHKPEHDRPRSTGAWTASDTNQPNQNSKATWTCHLIGCMDESHYPSIFIDPCWSTRIELYQDLLAVYGGFYHVPRFTADNSVVHTLYKDLPPDIALGRAVSAINRFIELGLRLSIPISPYRATLLSLIVPVDFSESATWYLAQSLSSDELLLLDQCIPKYLRLLERFGDCFQRRKTPRMKVSIDARRSWVVQPEQINVLCVAFMVELIHCQIDYLPGERKASVENDWAPIFAEVILDVEKLVEDCSAFVRTWSICFSKA